jgi:hypothetical protein
MFEMHGRKGLTQVLGSMWLVMGLVATAHAGSQRRIQLADGRELQGLVLPATECTWIVQTDDLCLELTAAQIARVDGKAGVATLVERNASPLLRTETFDDVFPDGSVLLHSSFARFNDGTTRIDRIKWGLAPHELALIPHWQAFDEFGNELPIQVEKRENGRQMARARLVRPIVPGETLRFTSRIQYEDLVQRDGDVLRYEHQGDYPEDRLVTKMVRLPAGATIVSVSPEPVQRFEIEDRPYVLWRRYYVAGEKFPLQVRYGLPTGE